MHRCTTLVFALALAAATSVSATDALTGNLTLASDYLFRGISQTDRHPAVQAGIEYGGDNGWYLGGWGSNISWLSDGSTPSRPVSSSVELDAYTGWRGNLGDGWRYDAGLYEYAYPGDYPSGYTRPHTLEGYAALGWQTLTLKYSRSFGNLFGVADSHGSGYLELAWQQPLAPGWTLAAHLGRQRVARHPDADYTDWKLGVCRTFGPGWSLALDWHDTNASRAAYTNAQGDYLGRATVLLSIAKAL